MASLVLGAIGTSLGSGFGGAILGLSGGTIGGMIGSAVGGLIDSWAVSRLAPAQRVEGQRIDQLQITSAAEGGVIPRLYGRMRIGGNIIWATDFNETIVTESTRVGGKGFGQKVVTTSYVYDASFAVALCEGPITGIGRVWADGEVMDLTDVTWRLYPGDEAQEPDPFIAALMGAETPAYRGTAYVMFEGLQLEAFGNRIPQLAFEVFRPLAEHDTAEGLARAVTLIPASGEFSLATDPVRRGSHGDETAPENANAASGVADIVVALDRLQASAPGIESVSLVVAWFGDDLRMAECRIQPRAEVAEKATAPLSWSVCGVTREAAMLVSTDAEGRPVYGGTPADAAVVQAIEECKARGLRVTFYPFILMDVPPDNELENPYSNEGPTGGWYQAGQCYSDGVPLTNHRMTWSDDDNSGAVWWTTCSLGSEAAWGASFPYEADWGLVPEQARSVAFAFTAGGLLNNHVISQRWFRPTAGPFEYVTREIGQPAFPWRGRITLSGAPGFAGSPDGTTGAATEVAAFFGTAAAEDFAVSGTEVAWTGGEDWGLRRMILHYAHLCAAAGGVDAFLIGSEMRGVTTVRGPGDSYPGVAAFVALLEDVRAVVGPGVRLSYAADWSEYFGHQPADGSGDLFFHLDPLWSHADCNFVGIDNYMPLADWRDGWDHLDAQDWEAIHDPAYLAANIEAGEGYDWFYASAEDRAAQIRTPITDGAAGKPWVFRPKDLRSWWSNAHYDRPGGVEAEDPTAWVPESKPIRFTELGCPAIDRGPNQPNVFYDPKSSESFVPWFSRGWRDDAVQRSFLEAHLRHWRDPAMNPESSEYAGRMIEVDEIALWTWDARPYPFFPALSDVWSDGENWRLGHWLTGRLGAVSLAALVRHLCVAAGLPAERVDVAQLWGAVEGMAIGALESPRASIAALGRHFGFDAFESEGRIVFRMRSRRTALSLAVDDLVATGTADADPLDLVRGQETELPQALKWQIARSDEDYDSAVVEARRITVQASRVVSESFPFAVPPEEAERRVRRALMETWVGRETAAFALPPSRLALDPSDVVELVHDGRGATFRLTSAVDGEARRIEAVREDRAMHDLPPGQPRAARLARAQALGAIETVWLNLPILSEQVPEHQPYVAARARPWPGQAAVYRSPTDTGFALAALIDRPAFIGALVDPLPAGPASRFDFGNAALVDLAGVALASVADAQLFEGANAFALESAPGAWEVLQAGAVELVAPGRYRLSRLLRGQRGTEWAIGDPAPAGARILRLDEGVVPLPINRSEVGLEANWRVGPAARPVTDELFVQTAFAPEGRGLIPFAPVHVEQPFRRGWTPGDLTIRWTRRGRGLAADSWAGLDIPLDEAVEAYEVDILDRGAVLRTLQASAPFAVYTEAQQVEDFGAPLWPGFRLDLRVRQISAFAAGVPSQATLIFAGTVPWTASARFTGFASNASGYADRTVRVRIADSALSDLGGYAARALLRASTAAPLVIGEAWIGLGSESSTWHFDGAPEQLLFDGAAGVTIPAGATRYSDGARLAIPAGRAVIVAFYVAASSGLRSGAAGGGFSSRYWTGNSASAVAPSGGFGLTGVVGLEGIDTV